MSGRGAHGAASAPPARRLLAAASAAIDAHCPPVSPLYSAGGRWASVCGPLPPGRTRVVRLRGAEPSACGEAASRRGVGRVRATLLDPTSPRSGAAAGAFREGGSSTCVR